MPQLGATFVPGGFDDYYMPEVLAPAPQRFVFFPSYTLSTSPPLRANASFKRRRGKPQRKTGGRLGCSLRASQLIDCPAE